MNRLISALIAALLVLAPMKASAEYATTFRAGADLTHYKNQTSIFSLGIENFDKEDGLGYKLELGAWTDIDQGRYSSPFASALLGKRFGNYDTFNATALLGIAVIGYPDSVLSTPFEFTEEVILGYKCVGIGFKHFSNAGIKEPNHGREYVSLTIAFPF